MSKIYIGTYCHCEKEVNDEQLLQNLPKETIDRYFGDKEHVRIYQGAGCEVCHFTGYAGRIGIFEVLEISNEIRKLITEKNDSDAIVKQAIKEGMTTMLDDGLSKVVKGQTTIEEVLRVTKIEAL